MDPQGRRLTIRFRLGLALALALMPVLALGVLQSWTTFARESEVREASLVQAAQRSASGARARIQAAVALLQTMTPRTVGLSCVPRLAELAAATPGVRTLARIDALGRVRCASATLADSDRRNADWMQRLRAGQRAVIERAPPAPGQEPGVIAAVRAEDAQGRFDGALVAELAVSGLRPDASDLSLPAGSEVAVLDGAGRRLTATRASAFAPLRDTCWPRLKAGKPCAFSAVAPDRVRRSYAATPLLPDGSAYALLSTPAPGLLSWTRLNLFGGLILPLLAWVLAWTAVWVVTDRVVIRWLAYLERIASIYAKGRFSVRPVQAENAPEEIRALAQTLDLMADGIVARDLSLRESLSEKDGLMREIHHRVKNNLQVITSLLNMQQRSLADPTARAAIFDTRQRIAALALIYRALYQSTDLRRVDVRGFLQELTGQLLLSDGDRGPPVRTELEADDLEIDPDKLAPLALFAVEALNNARKHAFGPEGGLIQVAFHVGPSECVLEIVDDGEGGPAPAGENGAGVGSTLMTAFARQLRGCAEFGARPDGKGFRARLIFPSPNLETAPAAPPAPPASSLPQAGYRNQAAA